MVQDRPRDLLRNALARSRLLRVILIVSVLNAIAVILAVATRRLDLRIAFFMVFFSACSWYFGLAAPFYLRVVRRLTRHRGFEQALAIVEASCHAVIGLVQFVLLAAVSHLWRS